MKTLVSTSLLLFLSLTLFAQKGQYHKERYKKIQKKKIEFLKKELQLTDQEKAVFMPTYLEYEKQRSALHQKRHQLMRKYDKNSLNLSDKECLVIADQMVEIEVSLAQLGKEYHEKFKTQLPPVKIVLFYKAEHKFKIKMLKSMKKRHKKGFDD